VHKSTVWIYFSGLWWPEHEADCLAEDRAACLKWVAIFSCEDPVISVVECYSCD
jgi:hypothetical protein